MFTGIVEEVGTVTAMDVTPAGARLSLRAARLAALAGVGDSISVAGCCLTAVAVEGAELRFDAVPETLRLTTLGALKPGDGVNLEDAVRAGEPFGGHLVQGHVDGVGEVVAFAAEGDGRRLRVSAPSDLLRYLALKGSVTVAGVSLTVAELHEDGFAVALIPHTLTVTTLGRLAPGDLVNLEVDIVARHVERLLAR
jgi:riboflavin synthase